MRASQEDIPPNKYVVVLAVSFLVTRMLCRLTTESYCSLGCKLNLLVDLIEDKILQRGHSCFIIIIVDQTKHLSSPYKPTDN